MNEKYFTVCEHCLRGIESREGDQFVRQADDDGQCDWCKEYFEASELYYIL